MIIIKYSVMEFSEVLKKVVFVFGLEVGDGSEVARVRDFFFFFIIFSGIRSFSPLENLARN